MKIVFYKRCLFIYTLKRIINIFSINKTIIILIDLIFLNVYFTGAQGGAKGGKGGGKGITATVTTNAPTAAPIEIPPITWNEGRPSLMVRIPLFRLPALPQLVEKGRDVRTRSELPNTRPTPVEAPPTSGLKHRRKLSG